MLSRFGQKTPEKPLEVKDGLLKTFECIYTKKTKSRKKCPYCGRLIKDGENVIAELTKSEKYYPVKGLMYFTVWHFYHNQCVIDGNEMAITNEAKRQSDIDELQELLRSLENDE